MPDNIETAEQRERLDRGNCPRCGAEAFDLKVEGGEQVSWDSPDIEGGMAWQHLHCRVCELRACEVYTRYGWEDHSDGEPFTLYKQGDKRVVELSPAAYATLCGLVQSSEDVYSPGIFSEAFEGELTSAFPLADFHAAVAAGTIEYDAEAGE